MVTAECPSFFGHRWCGVYNAEDLRSDVADDFVNGSDRVEDSEEELLSAVDKKSREICGIAQEKFRYFRKEEVFEGG